MKHQVNIKNLSDEEWHMLLALSEGAYAKACPVCGKNWDLNNLVTQEPIPHSRLAAQFLKEKIRDEFDKAQFVGKH